jgi:formyltetrahydrofolate synthetase
VCVIILILSLFLQGDVTVSTAEANQNSENMLDAGSTNFSEHISLENLNSESIQNVDSINSFDHNSLEGSLDIQTFLSENMVRAFISA